MYPKSPLTLLILCSIMCQLSVSRHCLSSKDCSSLSLICDLETNQCVNPFPKHKHLSKISLDSVLQQDYAARMKRRSFEHELKHLMSTHGKQLITIDKDQPKKMKKSQSENPEHHSYFSITGIIVVIFISAFANAGGIGAGSVIVPALTIFFGFGVKSAIPLSKSMIFAGGVINVLFLLNTRRDNNKNKLLIDYVLCSFMLPLMMCGTFLGVYLNLVVPQILIIVLLTLYLGLSIHSLSRKFSIIVEKENKTLGITLKAQLTREYQNLKIKIRQFFSREPRPTPAQSIQNLKPKPNPDQKISYEFDMQFETKAAQASFESDSIDFEANLDNARSEQIIAQVEITTPQVSKSERFLSLECAKGNLLEDLDQLDSPKKEPFEKLIVRQMYPIMILIITLLVIIGISVAKKVLFINEEVEEGANKAKISVLMLLIVMICLTMSYFGFRLNLLNAVKDKQNSKMENLKEYPGQEKKKNKDMVKMSQIEERKVKDVSSPAIGQSPVNLPNLDQQAHISQALKISSGQSKTNSIHRLRNS